MRINPLMPLALLVASALSSFATGASAQTPIAWSANATAYRGQIGARLIFVCPPGGSASSIWGTDTYTDDSSICTAAVHAGAVAWDGGVVTVLIQPGADRYAASTRNGVTSQRYPAWTGSFTFVNVGGSTSERAAWRRNAAMFVGQTGPIAMTCPSGGSPEPVWGTDYYTSDSSVCTAAVHAGVIDIVRGGAVTFYMFGGLGSYPGSSRNGLTTSSWGSYTSTFAFTPNLPTTTTRSIAWSDDGVAVVLTGQTTVVTCPGDGTVGSVWGTDIYSADSSVCTAAVHAGVISLGGGSVMVTGIAGQRTYAGSLRNGITSRPWGAWDASFVVARVR